MTTASGRATDRGAPALVTEIVAAHAAGLARRARYSAAEELIGLLLDSGQGTPRLLDLLARIRVRQGRIEEAASLWREALAKDGGNLAYRSALDCVSRNRHPAAKRIAAIIMAGVAFASLSTGIGLYHGSRRGVQQPPAVSIQSTTVQTRSPLDPEQFRSPRATPEVHGDSVKIMFREPLFSQGVRLTEDGKLVLAEIAEKLRPYARTVDLTITGETDSVPARKAGRYSDNTALGLMRAVAAYNEICRRVPDLRQPNLRFEARQGAAGQVRDRKQRTATIVLTPAAPANE